MLIAGIRVMKERHMAIGGDQKRQSQDAQIVPAFLAVAALGSSAWLLKESTKVKKLVASKSK